MMMLFQDEADEKKMKEKKTSYNYVATTLLICLLSCLLFVDIVSFFKPNIRSAPIEGISSAFRALPPSTYALNIRSYSKLVSTAAETFQTDVFEAGGYNWTLILYPTGNTKDNGADHISLYLKLYNPASLPQGWEIHTQIKFFVQVKAQNKYLVVEDTDAQRFNAAKTEWGLGKVIQLSTFKNENNGYLVGDECQFGVELVVLKPYRNSERLSFFENPENGKFTWRILHFSQLEKSKFVYSDEFSVAGTNWKVRMAPKGDGDGWQNYLSIYLELSGTQKLRVNEKVYAKAKIRVLNTDPSKNKERQLGMWYSAGVPSLGFQRFMPLADLHDANKGYLVGDKLTLQIDFHLISNTDYLLLLPSTHFPLK